MKITRLGGKKGGRSVGVAGCGVTDVIYFRTSTSSNSGHTSTDLDFEGFNIDKGFYGSSNISELGNVMNDFYFPGLCQFWLK